MDMLDLYNNFVCVNLKEPAQVTGDGQTDYVDTADADGVMFMVFATTTTADATANYIELKLYGTNSATPTTFTNYTRCTAAEVNGSHDTTYANLDVIDATGAHLDWISLKQHNYRYYCIKMDETGTADSIISAVAILSKRHQPAGDDTVTTGTPA